MADSKNVRISRHWPSDCWLRRSVSTH